MPRCKNCKDKFEVKHFNQKFCMLKDECITAFSEFAKAQAWVKRKREMQEELETVQSLLKRVQKVFNEFIRLRDKDKSCVSCGAELTGKYDAGHYFSSGGHKNVTFNEDNVHGQCVYCNPL